MLTEIHIHHFTIIDNLQLSLEKGFTTITGETGAGKSIILDAVNLALGGRGDSSWVRTGQDKASITLCFDISDNNAAIKWLDEHELAEQGECIIQRTLSHDGKSRTLINGRPAPQALAKELGERLLIIHGQHQSQALLQANNQRARLDHYAHNRLLLQESGQLYQQWQNLEEKIQSLMEKNRNKEAEIQLLQFQLNELTQAELKEDEWDTLSNDQQQLQHSKDILNALYQSLAALTDDEHNITNLLYQAKQHLQRVSRFNEKFNDILSLLDTAEINLQEATNELQILQNHLDLDPDNLNDIEQRMRLLHDLARKHKVKPNQLLDIEKNLREQLDNLTDVDSKITELKQQQQQLVKQYQKIANQLTKQRQQAADELNILLTKAMQTLNMEGGQFQITLIPNKHDIHPQGNESIQFLVSTNPGQPFGPLSKVVSGGELSRISLALETLLAAQHEQQCLIFDEVDTGIGGKTADVVGDLLKQLGEQGQVLCVTHLPQVAAKAHQQLKVEKIKSKNSTETTIHLLSHEQRIEEIARMLAGKTITDHAKAQAEQLLSVIPSD